ncbi:MAG: MotA/TolQ/ExbB proton channel family protein [Verrucomicrobiae bacterium]|nr:MotA/TolQ/ExbB proton channel family protein [Verrucomicrobiae bacterium]
MTTRSVSPEKPFLAGYFQASVCLGAVLFAPQLWAQDEATGEVAKSSQSFLDLLLQGGWAMIPLALCSIAIVFLAVFNFIQLTKSKFCPADLEASLMDNMRNCMVRSAIEVASTSPTFLGRMMAYSLPAIDATKTDDLGREAVEDKMADFTMKENRPYMNWITYLSIIAQVAPMLGLLGTVSGMIRAFGVLATTGGTDPQKLSGSISEALITTATGLAIAIPALALFFFFRNKLTALVADAHSSGEEMLDVAVASVHGDQLMAKVPEGLSVQ